MFLPPLLFATAQKSSWAVIRVRWRTLLLMAVALVVVSTAVVAGAAWLMIPGIGIPAAIALGAMVAPPDPVAVESVAGRVHMPRRLITVLQSEGLFNDAAAIVIFQAAVAATLAGSEVGPNVIIQFVVGAALAVVIGIAMGWLTKFITKLVTSMVARSAVTLVVPFAAYILAEELHASDVVAVVVTALELQRHSRPQDAAERITRRAFWDVVELLATLALALALPLTLPDGSDFPARHEILVIVCAVLLATLVLPGLTLPWLMRVLNATEDGSHEKDAARLLAKRAQSAAVAALKDHDLMKELPPETVALVRDKMRRLHAELLDGTLKNESTAEKRERGRELAIAVQAIALDAARQEVVDARNEPGTDPEIADRVLRQLDLRTMSMPE
ncbi:cation:proton antiporter [Paenarthrobacter sp. PAE-2]|nr:cation:proton antiporter [Paenarthrobacter sp. PAE-2]